DVDTDGKFTLRNIIFAGRSHKNCVICSQEIRGGSVVMPKDARLDLLIYHSMYAPDDVHCCSSHLLKKKRLMPNLHIITKNRMQLESCLSSSEMIDLVTD
ncbi:unnamed protein product, partial [Rotaria sp. Silwood2]